MCVCVWDTLYLGTYPPAPSPPHILLFSLLNLARTNHLRTHASSPNYIYTRRSADLRFNHHPVEGGFPPAFHLVGRSVYRSPIHHIYSHSQIDRSSFIRPLFSGLSLPLLLLALVDTNHHYYYLAGALLGSVLLILLTLTHLIMSLILPQLKLHNRFIIVIMQMNSNNKNHLSTPHPHSLSVPTPPYSPPPPPPLL